VSGENATSRRWYKARLRELRELVWEWDPLGLRGAPEDEYDSLVDGVLSALVNEQRGGDAVAAAVVNGLEYMAGAGFSARLADLHSQSGELEPFVARVRQWWDAAPRPPAERLLLSGAPCPVFVFGEDPVPGVFLSVANAAGHMEAIDVRDGEYHAAYTIDGRVVTISTVGERVVLDVTEERDMAGLRRRLRTWHERGNLMSDPDDLVAIANELLRGEWETRWPKRPRWLSRHMHGAEPPQI
jgi:hypothetical protein